MTLFPGLSSFLLTIRKNVLSVTNTSLMNTILYSPIVLIVAMTILIFWFYKSLPPQIPLFYSRPWGQEQMTAPIFLFLLPGESLLWYIACLVLVGTQTHQHRVFSQILLMIQCVSSMLALLVIINIVRLIV